MLVQWWLRLSTWRLYKESKKEEAFYDVTTKILPTPRHVNFCAKGQLVPNLLYHQRQKIWHHNRRRQPSKPHQSSNGRNCSVGVEESIKTYTLSEEIEKRRTLKWLSVVMFLTSSVLIEMWFIVMWLMEYTYMVCYLGGYGSSMSARSMAGATNTYRLVKNGTRYRLTLCKKVHDQIFTRT